VPGRTRNLLAIRIPGGNLDGQPSAAVRVFAPPAMAETGRQAGRRCTPQRLR
jgi:hypothetical protein